SPELPAPERIERCETRTVGGQALRHGKARHADFGKAKKFLPAEALSVGLLAADPDFASADAHSLSSGSGNGSFFFRLATLAERRGRRGDHRPTQAELADRMALQVSLRLLDAVGEENQVRIFRAEGSGIGHLINEIHQRLVEILAHDDDGEIL